MSIGSLVLLETLPKNKLCDPKLLPLYPPLLEGNSMMVAPPQGSWLKGVEENAT